MREEKKDEGRKKKTKGKKRKDKELSTHKSQYTGMSEDTFSIDICV